MLAPRPILTTVVIFGAMLILAILQSFGISQLELPYTVRSVMIVTGGGALGFAASHLWIQLMYKMDSRSSEPQ